MAETDRCAAPQEPLLVVAIKMFIRGHLTDKLTLEDLAAHASLSKYHFLRRYKELAGRTPMDEVRRLRLERARELVLATGLPLKQVAELAGFCDEYYLGKAFRTQLGCSPGKLRGRG
jgi:transcriptional regulator GlxA family with amidase domain